MCGDQVVWRNGPGAARGGRGTGRPPRLCSRFRCKCIMPNLLFFGPQTTTRVRQTCAMGTQACSCGHGSLRSTRNGRGAGGQNKFACISCCRCMGATPAGRLCPDCHVKSPQLFWRALPPLYIPRHHCSSGNSPRKEYAILKWCGAIGAGASLNLPCAQATLPLPQKPRCLPVFVGCEKKKSRWAVKRRDDRGVAARQWCPVSAQDPVPPRGIGRVDTTGSLIPTTNPFKETFTLF